MKIFVSEVLYKKIITESGKLLDQVQNIQFEIKKKNNKLDELTIAFLEYGEKGILQRLGFKHKTGKKIPWKDVLRITKDAIFVKDQ